MFWTEKEIEGYLEFETRMVTMPDGTKTPINAMKLVWEGLEFLEQFSPRDEKNLVELALQEVECVGGRFEDRFIEAVGAFTKVYRQAYRDDLAAGIDPPIHRGPAGRASGT